MQAYNMHICKHISLCTLPIAYAIIYVLSYSHSKRHRVASGRARRAKGGESMRLTRMECLAIGFGWGVSLPMLWLHCLGMI